MAVSSDFSTSNQYVKYRIVAEETYVGSSSENYSNVNVKVQAWRTNTGYTTDGNGTCYCTIDGTQYSNSWKYKDGHAITYNSYTTLFETTVPISHNSDGSKSIYISSYISHASFSSSEQGFTVDLTKIERTPNFTQNPYVTGADESSITFVWGNVDIASDIYYSLDGSNWTHVTSTYTTITGLNENTTYTIYVQARNQTDNSQTSTATTSGATYKYPYIDGVRDFNIGESVNLHLVNPLRRNVTVYARKSDGSLLASTTSSNDTYIDFFGNSSGINTLYNSIPNDPNGQYYIQVVSGVTKTSATKTYSIDNSDGKCDPEFTIDNWSYTADLTNLTNDNQVVISGKSTITFSIDTPATAKLGASIDKYTYKWGSKQNNDGGTTISGGTSAVLTVTAIDTRGYPTETSIELGDNFINYKSITLTSNQTNIERENGVDTDTTMSFRGTYFNEKFGENGITNTITNAKYYVYDTSTSTWSSAYPADTSMLDALIFNNNYFSLSEFNIHEDGASGGFPIGTSYTLKVELTDAIDTYTFTTNMIVTDGKLAIDTFQDSSGDYHIGINGLASEDYNLYLHGNTNIAKTGYDGNSRYIKFADGGLICAGAGSVSVKCNSAIGNIPIMYRGGGTYKFTPIESFKRGTQPIIMIMPICTNDNYISTNVYSAQLNTADDTISGQIRGYATANGTYTVYYRYVAIGQWK